MDKFALDSLKGNLPVYPSINGKEEYFNSAVLVLLMMVEEEYHFVFEKRAAAIRQAGEICFPGGRFDPNHDESYQAAALRETAEELGVLTETIEILGPLDTVVANLGATVDAFLGVLNLRSLADLQINPQEVEEVFTVPVSYFESIQPEKYQVNIVVSPSYVKENGEEILLLPVQKLGLPERYSRPWGNILSNIYVYKVDKVTIWGITARLIRDVITRLKGNKF